MESSRTSQVSNGLRATVLLDKFKNDAQGDGHDYGEHSLTGVWGEGRE